MVDAEGAATYRTVKPGPMIEGLRVISEGLKADEPVIVLGLQSVRAGAKVNAQEAPADKFVTTDEQATAIAAGLAKPTAEDVKK